MKRRHLLQAAPLLALPAWAHAEGRYPDPTKTITLICPYPAGGNADQRSRQIGRYLNTALNVPVIVDNRGGAGGKGEIRGAQRRPGVAVHQHRVGRRIAGNLNITFPATTAAAMMERMPDLCVSTGSACSSAEVEPSYVLRALGLSGEQAGKTLRIAVGRFTSAADIDYAAAALAAAHAAASAERPKSPGTG